MLVLLLFSLSSFNLLVTSYTDLILNQELDADQTCLQSFSDNSEIINRTGAFIFTWTAFDGDCGSYNMGKTIILPLQNKGIYDFTVYWGDNTSDTYQKISEQPLSKMDHTYELAGNYEVIITGMIRGWSYGKANGSFSTKCQITIIHQWGSLNLGNTSAQFEFCTRLTTLPSDILDLNGTSSLDKMFNRCYMLSEVGALSSWNVEEIKSMSRMFEYTESINTDLAGWNIFQVHDFTDFMKYSQISYQNYDETIKAWSQLSLQPDVAFDGGYSFNSYKAMKYKKYIIITHHWEFLDANTIISRDNDYPLVITPGNLTVSYGQEEVLINWTAVDAKPASYHIDKIFNLPSATYLWNGSTVTLNLTQYNKIAKNIVISLEITVSFRDVWSRQSEDTITVNFLPANDTTIPQITDITILENRDDMKQVYWEVSDNYPYLYEFRIDGYLVETDAWNGSNLIFTWKIVDRRGYNFSIAIFDSNLHSNEDWVYFTLDNSIIFPNSTLITPETVIETTSSVSTTETTPSQQIEEMPPTDPFVKLDVYLPISYLVLSIILVVRVRKRNTEGN